MGVAIVVLGVMFLLQEIGLSQILGGKSLVSFFWPILLLAVGIIFLVKGGLAPGIVFISFSGLFVFSIFFGWEVWAKWWPVILIAIGTAILLGKTKTCGKLNINNKIESSDRVDDMIAFWGSDKQITSSNFQGGNITCVFGGVKLDLRNAKISKDGGKLNIFCAFGGVEIIVPPELNFEITGTAFLGGVENKTTHTIDPASPKLVINCTAAFGGVEIKN